jgi:hypothetical protein
MLQAVVDGLCDLQPITCVDADGLVPLKLLQLALLLFVCQWS